MIEPRSYESPKLRELIRVLLDWVNDEVSSHRIIVQDVEEDLFDGQVLQVLMEKLTGEQLQVRNLAAAD